MLIFLSISPSSALRAVIPHFDAESRKIKNSGFLPEFIPYSDTGQE
jgi:hypothetical protein